MSADPETIMDALLDHLKAQIGAQVKTYGRRVKRYDDTTVTQPAIFIRHAFDEDIWPGVGLQRTELIAELFVYAKTPKSGAAPDTSLNAIVKLIRAAMVPPVAEERLTLDGIVNHARIEGQSLYDPGDLDDQGKALIPIRIMLNSTYP
jgi:hypothetical protein